MNNTPAIIQTKADKSTEEKRFDTIEAFKREYYPEDFVRDTSDSDEIRQEIAKQSAVMVRAALLS